MRSLLAAAMAAGMRIVVSGETGAGKTTLVRAMTNELPADTRIVVIEDTRELNLGADPARAELGARVGDPRGEHRGRRRDQPARARPPRPALQPGLADRRRGPRRRRRPGDAARHAARPPEPLDRAPPLGAVGVEEARPVRRPGPRGGRVLDRRPADLRRRRLLRPPRPRPPGSAGRRRGLRGRRLERRPRCSSTGSSSPVPTAAACPRRTCPTSAAPAARARLRGSPPAQPGRVVATS